MARPKVAVIHTGPVLLKVVSEAMNELLPEVEQIHIMDDSLLTHARQAGGVTPAIRKRLLAYYQAAEAAGADLILNACSSVGEVADLGRLVVNVPLVKIDEAMAEEAVQLGTRIAVAATVPTTLGPTARLVERKAREAGKQVEVKQALVEGAFDVLLSGDAARHDQMVLERLRALAREADVIVLAQASMARLVPQLGPNFPVPVLSSPRSGVLRVKEVLAGQRPIDRGNGMVEGEPAEARALSCG